jgi:predicted DNA binding CopG/RHH family protein
MPKSPKSEFLQIRLTPSDRERIARAASSEHLEPSTWARQVLLKYVGSWEQENFEAQDVKNGEA